MGELLDSVEDLKPLRRGDVVEGVVMRSDHEGVLVNIGHKAEGLVPPGEMRTLQKEDGDLNIGDEIVAFVVKGETAEEAAILSIDRAVGEKGWRVLEKALESGELVKGKILGFNRGGSIVESEGVQAFVPMSQLVSVSRDVFREVRSQMDRAEEQATTEEQDGAEEQAGVETQAGAETQDGEAEDPGRRRGPRQRRGTGQPARRAGATRRDRQGVGVEGPGGQQEQEQGDPVGASGRSVDARAAEGRANQRALRRGGPHRKGNGD